MKKIILLLLLGVSLNAQNYLINMTGKTKAQLSAITSGETVTNSKTYFDDKVFQRLVDLVDASEAMGYLAGSYTDLETAINAAATDTALVIVHGRSTVSASSVYSAASNTAIYVKNGGQIVPTRLFTINGDFQAGNYPVFFTGKDSVRFGNGSVGYVKCEWFGAHPDSSASWNQRSINAAIKSVSDGYKTLDANATVTLYTTGTFLIDSTITIPNGVRFKSSPNTVIKLDDNSNTTMIKTYKFDDLTGSNTWLADQALPIDSIIIRFELHDLTLDGNKANQSSGNIMSLYGKSCILDNIYLYNAKDIALYSESGTSAGQEFGNEMPETKWNFIKIFRPDSTGILFRGPHDGHLDNIYISTSGDWNFRNESSATYSGNVDIGFMHVYSGTDGGVYVDGAFKGDYIQSESNSAYGLYLDNNEVQISKYLGFLNNRASGATTKDIYINSAQNQLSSVFVKDDSSRGAIEINNQDNVISSAVLVGLDGYHADAIKINSNRNIIANAHIFNFAGSAVWLDGAGFNYVNYTSVNNDTALHISSSQNSNNVIVGGALQGGDVAFIGPDSLGTLDKVHINLGATPGIYHGTSYHFLNDMTFDDDIHLGSGENTRRIEKEALSSANNNLNITTETSSGFASNINLQIGETSTDSTNVAVNIHKGDNTFDTQIQFKGNGSAVFNEASVDAGEFRIESGSNTSAFKVDYNNDVLVILDDFQWITFADTLCAVKTATADTFRIVPQR